MCDPLTLLAGGTALRVASSVASGNAAESAANQDAKNLEYQGMVEYDNALAESSRIRRAGARARGETLAGIAASGVRVGSGSALDVEREVMTDYETDAAMAVLNGDRARRGAFQQASMARRAGRDARRSGYLSAASSLLSSGSGGFGSYSYNGDDSGMMYSRSGESIRSRR